MADTKITSLASLAGASMQGADHVVVVDDSDTTMDTSGTNKVMTAAEMAIGMGVVTAASTQSGATYTLAASDNQTMILLSDTSPEVTIPLEASVSLPVGFTVLLHATGGPLTTVTASLTLNGSSPSTGVAQNEGLWCQKAAAPNTWSIIGGTA